MSLTKVRESNMIQKRKKQAVICLILFIISLIATILFHYKVKNQDIQYEAVKVTVISVESTRRHNNIFVDVIVEYEGEMYELINVLDGEIGTYEALSHLKPESQNNNPLFDNTVYYSNGKMYSNINGIKTDNLYFIWYLVGLVGIIVFITLFFVCIEDIHNRKKFEESRLNKREYM